jgi:IPT/TIG domain
MKHAQRLLLLAALVTGVACGYGSNYNSMASMSGSAPTLAELSPDDAGAGGAAFMLTVNGSNFATGAVVYFNGTPAATTYVSANQLVASIPAAAISTSGMLPVYVRSGNQNSVTVNFTVN